MRALIVRIGSSRGVRIPEPLLERSGLEEDVEIEAQAGRIVIRPAGQSRQGWEAAFEAMAPRGGDVLLDLQAAAPGDWDEGEWEW